MGAGEEPAAATPGPSGPPAGNSKAVVSSGDQFKSLLPGTQLTTLTSSAQGGAVPQAPLDLSKQPAIAKVPSDVQTITQCHSTKTQAPENGEQTAKKSAAKPATETIKTDAGLDAAKLSAAALQTAVLQNPSPSHDNPASDAHTSPVNQTASVEPLENSAVTPAPPAPAGDLALAVRVKPGSESPAKPVESQPAGQPAGEPVVDQTADDENPTAELSATPSATGERAAFGNAVAHAATSAPVHSIEEQHKSQSEGQPQSHGEGSSDNHVALNTSAVGNSKETSSTKSSDFEEQLNKVSSDPVKSAHVQLGSDGSKIDIRLVERAGSLSVSVRSTDSALTKALSDHTGELASRLTADHYKTELWTPNSASKGDPGRGGGSSSGGERQGGSAGGDTGKRQNPQGNAKQNQDPDWVQEFESIPGTFQKRIDYTWQQ